MANDWGSKPHIRIPEEALRREPKKSRQPPPPQGEGVRDSDEIGRALVSQLDSAVNYCKRPEKIISEDFTFILATEKPIHLEGSILNRFGLTRSLQIDDHSAVVTIGTTLLPKFRQALVNYVENKDLRTYIKEINSISKAVFPRTTLDVSQWLDSSLNSMPIELELLPNLGEENYAHLMEQLLSFVRQANDEIFGTRIREESASLRACLKPQTAKKIAQGVDSLWKAKKAPRIIVAKPQRIAFDKNPIAKPPNPDAHCICVLDTGIDQKHPLVKDVLVDAIDLTSENSPQDAEGHGTFVSGLAAYGDLESRGNPEASSYIVSAKVLGSDPYSYLETYIEEAVRRYHDQSKIFNLSVMYETLSDFSQPTDLAYTIDKLSRKYQILFVVSSGNIRDDLQSFVSSQPYPAYLSKSMCKVYAGAEACTCVTVGGIAHKESDRSIARLNEPSPFTRRGEFSARAKPDVVSAAGNIERDDTGNIQGNNNLSVISLGLSPDFFACDCGTSFSAPIVSNILARLAKEYPSASPNLLKALLVHFASWPNEHYRLNASDNLKKALFGKGTPDFYRCSFSTRSSATYILEDAISFNEILWVPVYVPRIMKKIYGDKVMRITLVYDPPIDRSIAGYTCVDLDFQVFKELKQQHNLEKSYRQQWDNVKSDIFRWQKSGWGKEWSIMIVPRVRFKDKLQEEAETSQRFALVVSLEDPNQKVDIYNAILNERKKMVETLEVYVQRRRNKRHT